MTANDFRKLALALPETEERAHMSHPAFRVAGKIFATLGYPDKSRGMVKLSPEDQPDFSKDHPEASSRSTECGDAAVCHHACILKLRKRRFCKRRSKPPGATPPPAFAEK